MTKATIEQARNECVRFIEQADKILKPMNGQPANTPPPGGRDVQILRARSLEVTNLMPEIRGSRHR